MNDEAYYLEASKEFDSGVLDAALWTKIVVLLEGDENRAKYKYIQIRSQRLMEKDKSSIIDDKALLSFNPEKLIAASEFAHKNNLSEGHVIDLIRGGKVQGERIDDCWFLSDVNIHDLPVSKPLGERLAKFFRSMLPKKANV